MGWDYKRYGSASQLVHKSALSELSGKHACPRRFRYSRDEPAKASHVIGAKTALGTAVHAVIARVLTSATTRSALFNDGQVPQPDHLRSALMQELARAAEDRELDVGGTTLDALIDSRVAMLVGTLASIPYYVAEVLHVEAAFTVAVQGGLHFGGHIDLVFRPRSMPCAIALADWKTGAQKPHPLELAHGWESGVYALACRDGHFLDSTQVRSRPLRDGSWLASYNEHEHVAPMRWLAERQALELALQSLAAGNSEAGSYQLSEYPTAVYHVHMADFVPYQRAGKRMVSRDDELPHYGLTEPTEIQYAAGDLRGPGWLPIARHEQSMSRLVHRTRNVVGTIRMGRFTDVVGEQCTRCPYAKPCLNDGYAPTGAELDALESKLRAAGL